MYKIHVVVSVPEETPFADVRKDLLFFSSFYDHTLRKFTDAAFALKLDCSIVPCATFDLEGYTRDILADVNDIIIFTSPYAFLAPAQDIENALSYVISSELGYATVGSMRGLYACIGTGKMMLDNSTLNTPYDFISTIGRCGAKCEGRAFCEAEAVLCSSREEYSARLKRYKREYFAYLTLRGIHIEDYHTVVVSPNTDIGKDTYLLPGTQICAGSKIGTHCVIGPSSVVSASTVGTDSVINASHIYSSSIEAEANIGPFSHVDKSQTLHKVRIGAYTEVRCSNIGAFSEIETHCLIAHCKTGPRVLIGSHVTCANFDGQKNNTVKIGEDAFIGSGTVLIAPVSVGNGAYSAAGSTITDNIPAGSLGIAREYQSNHDGWTRRKRK